MKNIQRCSTVRSVPLAACAVITMLAMGSVAAKTPPTSAEIEDQQNLLLSAVKHGDDLWHSAKLGNNGLACGNCHPDGSATNPHTFPKYQSNLGKVGTLREMINWCIAVPLVGTPLASDSDDMIAMEAYVMHNHRGVAIAPAKDEQHGGTPVISGPGYPNAHGGNR